MSLTTAILALRDRTLSELAVASDHFSHTETAWETIRLLVAAGHPFAATNPDTGNTVDASNIVAQSQLYINRYLAEATLQQYVSVFESFMADFLRLWIAAHPNQLRDRKVDMVDVLAAPDKEAIVQAVVDRKVADILYERPANWFRLVPDRAGVPCPAADAVARFAEAKATRDVIVHNRGVVGRAYLDKAGPLARFVDGERVEVPAPYTRDLRDTLLRIVADVADASIARAP